MEKIAFKITNTMNDKTRSAIIKAFQNFDKWETYGTVFSLMTQRKARLSDIQEIAWEYIGIDPEVIAMRRRDVLTMHGGLEAHRKIIKGWE
jgi:hypothetical protein